MGNLFGGGTKKKSERAHKDDQVTDKDRAILDLKNARDRLKKYRKRLEKDSKDLEEKARELIRAKQKNRALLVLKLRRFKDEEATKIEGELLSVYEMIENVEWEHANMDVLKALKAGNVSLNKLHQEMSADDVAELLEETNEAIEVENSINAMLAGQFDVNDEELERELAELMGESVESAPKTADIVPVVPAAANLPAVPTVPVLPAAPTTDIDFEAAAQRAEKHDAVLA